MNFLDTIIKEMKIRLSGGGFGATRANNFLHDGSFRFKFGRQLDQDVKNKPLNFHIRIAKKKGNKVSLIVNLLFIMQIPIAHQF